MGLINIAFDTMPDGKMAVYTFINPQTRAAWAIMHVIADGVFIPIQHDRRHNMGPVVTAHGVPVFETLDGAMGFLEAWDSGDREWAPDVPEVRLRVVDGRLVRQRSGGDGR